MSENMEKKFFLRWALGIFISALIIWNLEILGYVINPLAPPFNAFIILLPALLVFSYIFSPLGIIVLSIVVVFFWIKNKLLLKKVITVSSMFLLIYFLAALILGPFSAEISTNIQARKIGKILTNEVLLTELIYRYESEHGSPPTSLDELGSETWLLQFSQLSGLSPDFEYTINPSDPGWEGNSWILIVKIPVEWLNDVIFIYPSNNFYPEDLVKYGDWVFLSKT